MSEPGSATTSASGRAGGPAGTPCQRIVSLVPSATETLHALGVADRVVGRTRYCVHPRPWVDGLPACGGTKDPDLGAIAALRPDLIVVNQEENRPVQFPALAAIAPLHVAFPRDVDGALADIRALAARIGAEEAGAALAGRIAAARARVHAVLSSATAAPGLPGLPGPPESPGPPGAVRFRYAYFIWRRPWMSVNADTFIHALLAEAGGHNVCAAHAERYPVLSLDELRSADPDVLLLASEPYPFAAEHAAEFAELAPRCRLVDGELLSWHGARLEQAFPYLAAHAPVWAARPR